MPGVEALIEAFADRVLLRPRHDLPNLVDLAGAVARLCGVDLKLTHHAEDMVETIGTSDHLVLTLADGVGMNMVEMLSEDSFPAQPSPQRLDDGVPVHDGGGAHLADDSAVACGACRYGLVHVPARPERGRDHTPVHRSRRQRGPGAEKNRPGADFSGQVRLAADETRRADRDPGSNSRTRSIRDTSTAGSKA